MPPLSDVPACRYQQPLSRYIACQGVCVQESRCNLKWTFKICCHYIITR